MISHSTPLGAVLFSCLTLPRMPVYLLVALPAHQNHVVQVKSLLLIQALRNQMMQLCLADKYGYDIELLPIIDGQKSADTYNHTLQKKQEYKVNKTATASSIDNLIRDGKNQADSIVLRIDSEITLGTLQDAVQNRVNRERNITDVTLIRNEKDVTFTREQIISESFKIQPEDFR